MKQLVHQNAGQLPGLPLQFLVQHNLTLSNKRTGVDRLTVRSIGIEAAAVGGQRRQETKANTSTLQCRQPPFDGFNGPAAIARVPAE